MSALLRHPVVATAGISAVIIALAVILSIVSYQALGQTNPGLTYEVLSALGISTLLAPTFLYPWIRTAAKLRQATVVITRLARTDALTGLPNSFVLRERMRQVMDDIVRGGPFAVLFVDLDHFKQINDTLGHPRGDALLAAVADRLRKVVRNSDLVARFGGDEFVVLQSPAASAGEASDLASRIIDELSASYEIEGNEIVIGASVGIAMAPADGVEPDQLLRNADMALYRAKSHGKRTWRFFETTMAAAVQTRRNLELDLRAALANKAFEIHYQPILDLRTGKITTCEALIRWRRSSRLMVPPSDFIPVAEEMGIIVDLGAWVLREACLKCAAWPPDVRVAVNLSSIQFKRDDIFDTIARTLAHARLPADRLEIEITESLLLQDFPSTRATLERLRRYGVRIALDDFGTGYSGLSYLHSFPLDKVKIDRAFLNGLDTDSRSRTLLRGVAQLSAMLGLTVTVEGIETEEQLSVVTAETSVHEVQGYLFGAAMPDREISELLKAASTRTRSEVDGNWLATARSAS